MSGALLSLLSVERVARELSGKIIDINMSGYGSDVA
jgi:hypothetical protein